mgnify:FL=1
MHASTRVAIIGGGLSGLSCATTLIAAGVDVRVFDKHSFFGGRIGTKILETDGNKFIFDHGAQYFTIRSPEFKELVTAQCIPNGSSSSRYSVFLYHLIYLSVGAVVEWKDKVLAFNGKSWEETVDQPNRYVGVPGMRFVARCVLL